MKGNVALKSGEDITPLRHLHLRHSSQAGADVRLEGPACPRVANPFDPSRLSTLQPIEFSRSAQDILCAF